jgi:hypothetical protein
VTTQKHRAAFSGGISFVVAAAVAVVGCFGRPSTNVATMTCQQDVDCLSGYTCKVKGVPGGCCKPDDRELWATPGRSDANRWYTLNHGQYCQRRAFGLGRRCKARHGRSRGQRDLGRF